MVNVGKFESIKCLLNELTLELQRLQGQYEQVISRELQAENAAIRVAIAYAEQKLVSGFDLGQNSVAITDSITTPSYNATCTTIECAQPAKVVEKKILKENVKIKAKVEKAHVQGDRDQKSSIGEAPIDIGRLDLRIGKVMDVKKHPDADSLYVLQVDCAEGKLRTVCRRNKYVEESELLKRNVMVLCNLKPAKIRGINSEAMVMCAITPNAMEVLIPPIDCAAGDLVYCEGYTRNPDSVLNPKKKIFENVAPDLHTNNDLAACYKNVPLMVKGKGPIKTKSLKNVPVK